MDTAALTAPFLDADLFLKTDQAAFGTAWRYELVRGAIVAHDAPAPDHGSVLACLAGELHMRLRSNIECRSELGSWTVSNYQPRNTARIPDGMIRCGKLPRVLFDVISPAELQHKRQWDEKRSDLQAVEGVQEVIEIFQDEILAHAYRRAGEAWVFESIAGPNAAIELRSVGIAVPLDALYSRIDFEEHRPASDRDPGFDHVLTDLQASIGRVE